MIPHRFIPEHYRQCTKTLMDNIADPDILFDEHGVCNYYSDYFKKMPAEITHPELGQQKLEQTIEKIIKDGAGKRFDCIIGVSGGVDSTYLSLLANDWGLKPLAVHFDNGWNADVAVKNIEKTVSILDYDLVTHVFNWPQFRDLQLSHIKANVVDIEAVTDVAIHSVLVSIALKNNIGHILSGYNYKTESILPHSWAHKDYKNIKIIHKRFGTIPVTLFPYFNNWALRIKARFMKIAVHEVLDYIDYDKNTAQERIAKELNWVDYGDKHCETIFTRFYQRYILPQKFGIDKRKAHFSNLICSGQATKAEMLQKIAENNYDYNILSTDREFVLKKLGLTSCEFDKYLNTPGVSNLHYI